LSRQIQPKLSKLYFGVFFVFLTDAGEGTSGNRMGRHMATDRLGNGHEALHQLHHFV
jgi:hypothetical protein